MSIETMVTGLGLVFVGVIMLSATVAVIAMAAITVREAVKDK